MSSLDLIMHEVRSSIKDRKRHFERMGPKNYSVEGNYQGGTNRSLLPGSVMFETVISLMMCILLLTRSVICSDIW